MENRLFEPSHLNGWSQTPDTAASIRGALGPRVARSQDEAFDPGDDREGLCLATLTTRDRLHFALALVESFRRHHPESQAYVALVDGPLDADTETGEDRERALEDVEAVTWVDGRDLRVPEFPFLALKYDAYELSASLRPTFLCHVLRESKARKVVYLDIDTYLFAPLDSLLDPLEDHDFAVTPHTLAPMAHPGRSWQRPTLEEIAKTGILNSGAFALRATPEAYRFLETWQRIVHGPGTFLTEYPSEQLAFNWVTAFVEKVAVVRDPALNMAYWNLHERSLRCGGLDDEAFADRWSVNGEPLILFHFSGWNPDDPQTLSRYDGRYLPYLIPSLARLLDFYLKRLKENGKALYEKIEYRFSELPNGIELTPRIRKVFKHYEMAFSNLTDPWTREGADRACRALLLPQPGTGSLIPVLIDGIYRERPDLQAAFPAAKMAPFPLLSWIATTGAREYDLRDLFDRHRPVVPKREALQKLVELGERHPRLLDGIDQPFLGDRRLLSRRLRTAGEEGLAEDLESLTLEFYALSPLYLVRELVRERRDLRLAFPDLLFSGAAAFAEWLETFGVERHALPPGVGDAFLRCAEGRSLVRIYSFLNHRWELSERLALALVGDRSRELIEILFHELVVGREFDLDDVVMYRWLMEEEPWRGVPLTLELDVNRARRPSTLLPEGQEELLEPLLRDNPRFRSALRAYQETSPADDPQIGAYLRHVEARRSRPVLVTQVMEREQLRVDAGEVITQPEGINFFGYFRSPIGLGVISEGLASALATQDLPIARNLQGNMSMSADLSPQDYIQTYDYRLGRNLLVSYPHLSDALLHRFPPHWVEDRENIVYLAWEQRDPSPHWREVYDGFDHVWALSSFAAEGLRRALKREVAVVPGALDFDAFPEPVSKESLGLDPDRLHVLYAFDANSSIERKNPEAALAACARAFDPSDPVTLVIKISNALRLEHRDRLQSFLSAVERSPLDIRLIARPMEYREVLELISAVDVYLSLHRAEGFGYTCAEAMGFAKPVIATGYSGNLDFMSEGNSFLVESREVEVLTAEGPFPRGSVWAEPDVEHAAELLRTVYRSLRDEPEDGIAAEHARQAATDVRRLLSLETVGQIAVAALEGPQLHLVPSAATGGSGSSSA